MEKKYVINYNRININVNNRVNNCKTKEMYIHQEMLSSYKVISSQAKEY